MADPVPRSAVDPGSAGGPPELPAAVIRFAGDSGDGMQTVGELFAYACAAGGLHIRTLPEFPSEIRAPAGSLPGVSSFQVHFGDESVQTAGDRVDTLIAMNPAALRVNLDELSRGGTLIVNRGAFTPENLKKAGYRSNPLERGNLGRHYRLVAPDMNALTLEALADTSLRSSEKLRCRNFFALGMACGLYGRNLEQLRRWIDEKWSRRPETAAANRTALEAGRRFAGEAPAERRTVRAGRMADGVYRKISGNEATALGLITGSEKGWREILFAGYPITPASSIMEFMARQRHFVVKTVQAEDEIAAIAMAIGGAYAGGLGVTATSGPGFCLMAEALNLAVMTELPLVVVNVMRAGPSTGMPTKAEQADLLQALYGRSGESPLPVLAAASPADAFETAVEAVRIALHYRTPVVLLSDAYIANSAEIWAVPSVDSIPEFSIDPMRRGERYVPYQRDPQTLARRLGIPGRPGFEHRIGGLEKDARGRVSTDPANHEKMVAIRRQKVLGITRDIPPLEVYGDDAGALLIVGWGGTRGAVRSAVDRLRARGARVGHVHLRHLHPLPTDLGGILGRFRSVLVPEMNLGQLSLLLRARYRVETVSHSKVQGRPFKAAEIVRMARDCMEGRSP